MATRIKRKFKLRPARKTRKGQTGGRKVLDARSTKDIKLFENMIVTGPLTLVFAKLQGCGPCERFNSEVWSHLTKLKRRGMNLASIDSELINSTSLANVPRKFYPTLLLVGKDKKAAIFKDENGQPTNAMPRKPSLEEDKKALSALVQTPTANEIVTSALSPMNAAPFPTEPMEKEEDTMMPQESSRTITLNALRNSPPRQILNTPGSLYDEEPEVPSMMNTMASIKKNKTQARRRSTVPDVATDLIATQMSIPVASAGIIARETSDQMKPQTGGTLLRAIRKQNAAYKAVLDMRKKKNT
jgi:hypothetical protein